VGEVALAEDQDIGRPVAVKRLLPQATNQGFVARFVEEVRIMGQLEHPGIVPVHDVGVDASGRLYFVMKKVEGETLEQIIAKLATGDAETHRRYPLETRIEIILSVLRAVQYAHAMRVIHRDIKPSNVMVGRYGEVVVMDWGIAKRLGDPVGSALDAAPLPAPAAEASVRDTVFRTRNGQLLGTPAYMSPEQARGANDQVDERSDIYSLAVLCYELLTLRHPLAEKDTVASMLEAVQKEESDSAFFVRSPHQPPVPLEISNFIEDGLTKDPKARYQSVGEMIESLHRAQSGNFAITCQLTLAKRSLVLLSRAIDAHPQLASYVIYALPVALLGGLGLLGWALVR
jgi:serine/threonine-protein kinase